MDLKSADCGCGCSSGPRLIFSCSGAADVGELTDRAARKLLTNVETNKPWISSFLQSTAG